MLFPLFAKTAFIVAVDLQIRWMILPPLLLPPLLLPPLLDMQASHWNSQIRAQVLGISAFMMFAFHQMLLQA